MNPLRVLVVGVGFMGSLHARTLRSSRQATLCAVVDRSQSAADTAAAEFGVPAYTDLAQAIEETRPDAAIIATPDPFHREPVETAIEAGLAVLIEKPLATTTADAEAIVELATQRGTRLMTGHIGRFYPRYVATADAVHSGRLGKPVMVTASTWGQTALGARVSGMTNPLWHFAIHDIDTLQWVTGGVVSEVHGAQIVESASGVSVFAATGTLSTGAGFHLAAGWTLPGKAAPRRDVKVHCEQGVVEATWRTDGVTVTAEDGAQEADCMAWPTLHGAVEGALRLELDHFVSAVIDGTPFVITPEDAVNAVRSAAMLEQAAVIKKIE